MIIIVYDHLNNGPILEMTLSNNYNFALLGMVVAPINTVHSLQTDAMIGGMFWNTFLSVELSLNISGAEGLL